jgi:hypothetical protein
MTPAACSTVQEGAPWYQRFGLDHNQQLLDAMLPWYGVANNRLIRDPANAADTKAQRWQTLPPTATSVHSWRNRVMTSLKPG